MKNYEYDEFIKGLLSKYHFSRKTLDRIYHTGLYLGCGAALLCLILFQFSSTKTAALIVAIFGMLSFLISGIFCELFCRCPHCHKRAPASSASTHCMFCGKPLDGSEEL